MRGFITYDIDAINVIPYNVGINTVYNMVCFNKLKQRQRHPFSGTKRFYQLPATSTKINPQKPHYDNNLNNIDGTCERDN